MFRFQFLCISLENVNVGFVSREEKTFGYTFPEDAEIPGIPFFSLVSRVMYMDRFARYNSQRKIAFYLYSRRLTGGKVW